MEPVVFPSLRRLHDREEPDCTQSGPVFFSNSSPYYHLLLSASQEEVDLRSPQTCCEIISRVEQFSSGPHLMTYESAEMQRQWALWDLNQQCGQHVIPSLSNPYQPHVLNVLPGVRPCPLSLQTLPVVTPLLHDLTVAPCWPSLSPFTSTPNSTFSFHPNSWVPVSSLTEFSYSSLPPCSRLFVPDVCPSCCVCPQAVPVQQPWSPHLVWRTAQQVIESGGQIQEEAKSEGEEQRNNATNWDKLQANNKYDTQHTGGLPCLDEVSLAELLDSISPKIQESVKVEPNDNFEEDKKKKPEIESSPFLEYLDELCSDEDFVRDVELILDTEYLDSLLSSDPQPTDCLALEKQQQEMTLQEHQRYVDTSISPVGSTPNAEYLDLLREQQPSRLPPANSNSTNSVTEEISLATLLIGEPAPLQTAQAPILHPLGSQFDTNPSYNGLLWSFGPEEHWTRCSPLLPSIPLEEPLPTDNPVNATSRLYPNGSLMDCIISSLRLLADDTFPNTSLTSGFKARDNDVLVKELAATEDESKEASTPLPNFGNAQSAWMSHKPQEGTLPGDSPAFEPSVSGSSEDPRTTALKDPAPSFRADSLAAISPQSAPSVPALKAPPEEQHSPQNMSSRLVASPVPADSSFVADSHADPCDPPADGDLSASAPGKLTVETPKRLLVCKVLASSELRAGERSEKERKDAAMQKQTATKTREEETTKTTFEKKEESKDSKTKLKGTTNTRRSQRLSGKEQARLIGEYTTERVEEKKPSERSAKKTAKFTPERVYEKQKRRSSGGRQLFKRESNFEVRGHATKTAAKQFPEIGEKEHQELSGETQKLKVEGREQSEAKSPSVSIKTGPENAALTQIPQGEKELSEGEGNKEGMQMSSFVRRGTQSTTEEKGLPLPAAGGEIESSHGREMQNKLEVKKGETEALTLLVSSPMKRRRNRAHTRESREKADDANNTNSSRRKTNENKVSLPESSLHSPEVQTDSHSTKESPEKGPLDDICESRSVETCKKTPKLTLALSPEALQSKVRGSETLDFYSLRSQNVSRRTENNVTWIQKSKAAEAARQPSNPKATADAKEERTNVKGAKHLSAMLTPMKTYIGVNDEGKTRVKEMETETDMSLSKNRSGKERSREKTDNASDTNSPGGKTNKDKVSPPEFSLRSPKVQKGTCSTKESLEEVPLDEKTKSPFVKTCRKTPNLTSDLSPAAQQTKVRGSETFKTNNDKVSLPGSSLQSPKDWTGTRSTKESRDERRKSLSVTTCGRNPNSTSDLSTETLQQSKTVAWKRSGDGTRCGDVTGTETWDFYSLRSQNVSKRTVNSKTGIQESEAAKATHRPSNPKTTADVNKERINAEEAEHPSLTMSPMTRYRRDRDASEEKETETSPMKRGRWKSRAEGKTEKEEEQKLTSRKKSRERPRDKDEAHDKAETCKPSSPSTRSSTRATDGKISNVSAAQESFKEVETRTSRKKAPSPRFPRRRLTLLSKKLPSKCQDFILGKTNTSRRQLDKKKGKVGRGRSKIKKVC